MDNLRRCAPTDDVLELMYRVALAHERHRDYRSAADAFRGIQQRRAGYRDVDEHLRALESSASGGGAGATGATAQTLVLPSGALQRPVLGRYEIERELGRGAMGVVYLGKDPKIGRQVAIKTLEYAQFEAGELAMFRERFTREAEAAGRLNHPGIVTVYDVGEEDDLAFIAMDYVPGQTLNAFVEEDHLLPAPIAIRLAAEVADALDYAHREQIVHRDIKPGNLIYNPEQDRVKVTDFGIARTAGSSRTRTGALVGSPSYMAPEQLTGDTVDGRADIFSLGVTLYQLTTGQLPFEGENLAGLAYQITKVRHEDVRSVRPDLPPALSRVVNRALRKKPDSRFATAAEMAEALRRIARRLGEDPMAQTVGQGTMQ
jgi:serine/threonine-protein kinase